MPTKNTKRTADYSGRINFAAALMIFIFLLHFLPLAFPKARLWGINHLLFISPFWIAVVAVSGLAAMALLVPSLRKKADQLFTSLGDYFFADSSFWCRLIFCIAAPLVFWLLRMPVHFLGDGYNVVQNIGNDVPVIVKWSETGAVWIIKTVAGLLPLTGIERGDYAYALVSVVSGTATLFVFFLLAGRLGRDAAGKLLVFCLLMFSGWTLLFFGYAENYPLLWPFITAYLYFALKYIQEGKGLWPATIMLLVASALHLQIVFFGLSYPFLIFARGRGAGFYKRYKKIVWVTICALLIAGVYLFLQEYRQSLRFRLHFMSIFAGPSHRPDYFLFSPQHLADIFNLTSLLIPLWPGLLFVAVRKLARSAAGQVDSFLLLFSLGGFVLLFIIDPKLGMARDWDLFALCMLGPMLLLTRRFAAVAQARRLYPFMTILALVMVLPYFTVNLTEKPSLKYYDYLLRLDLSQARPGMIFMRDYYKLKGDSVQSKAIDREIWKLFPANRLARQASRLSREGKFNEAMVMVDSLFRINPFTIEALNTRGMVYLKGGYFREAIRDLETAATLGRYEPRSLVNLGNAYYQTGQFDKMLVSMRKAQKLNPEAKEVLQGFAMGFYAMNQFDSALVYGHYMINIDSTVPYGHLGLGLTYYKLGGYEKSKKYLTRFLEIGPPGADRDLSLKLLTEMAREEK